jgi:hypothetical protein
MKLNSEDTRFVLKLRADYTDFTFVAFLCAFKIPSHYPHL